MTSVHGVLNGAAATGEPTITTTLLVLDVWPMLVLLLMVVARCHSNGIHRRAFILIYTRSRYCRHQDLYYLVDARRCRLVCVLACQLYTYWVSRNKLTPQFRLLLSLFALSFVHLLAIHINSHLPILAGLHLS